MSSHCPIYVRVDININNLYIYYISINIQVIYSSVRIKHFTYYFDDECFPVILDFLDDRVANHVKNMLFKEGNEKWYYDENHIFPI